MTKVDTSICELDPSFFDFEAVTFSVNQVFRNLQKKSGLKGPHFNPNDKENIKQHNYGQRCRVTVDEAATLSSPWDRVMPAPDKPHRPNRLSRSQKLKKGKLDDIPDTKPDHQSPKTSVFHHREPFSEDVLWTDKYHPEHSREVIGNRAAVQKLHSWLKKWKLKTDSEERLKYEEALNKQTNDCWDCGDFVDEVVAGDRSEEHLCNTVLLTGPTGVGKTAAVYACAMELGFKVFEVNCSSRRCGQDVLAQLKEATQSHLVETSDPNPLKPAFFNSCNTDRRSTKAHTLPAKTLKKATCATSKSRRVQKRSNLKNKANPITLTSYFTTKAKAQKLYHRAMSTEKSKKSINPAVNVNQRGAFSKKMVTCLILFEEVDVIFEDDVGFLAAIKTLMTITKRPVILTTTDPMFRDRFNRSLDEIYFQTQSMADVCSYLQLLCLAENIQLDSDDVRTLFKVTKGDVRRCLLQLQLWGNSGGGRSTAFKREFNYKGCSANMLGLQSVTQTDLQHLLHEEQMTKLLLQPLVESWRNGFPIMYSNLELLLQAKECSCHDPGENIPFCNTQQMEKTCMYSTGSAAKTKSRLSRRNDRSFSKIVTSPKALRSADEMDKTNSLSALSDFFDLMSFIDASMPQTQQAVAPHQLEDFVWTGAKIQDGQLDERQEEDNKSQEIMLDIPATLEVLGFRRCKKSSQRGNFAALDSKHLSLITGHLCPHSVYQRRFEVNKKVLSTAYFRLLHNTRAACTDYLPVIRLVCQTHRKRQKRRTEEHDWCFKSFRTRLGFSKKTVEILASEFC